MANIFVVHGMGDHGENWFDETEASIRGLRNYGEGGNTIGEALGEAGHPESINFIPLRYDDLCVRLFDEIGSKSDLENFQSKLSSASDDAVNRPIGEDEFTKWIEAEKDLTETLNPFSNNDFFKNNVWDVFLVANKITRHYLALYIVKQIVEELRKPENATQYWGVLAHSLGTALMVEVLNLLYTHAVGLGVPKASVVCMLANFSKVKFGDGNLLVTHDAAGPKSWVYPSVKSRKSVCRYYIGARHRFDPLAWLGYDMPLNWTPPRDDFRTNLYHVLGHSHLSHGPAQFNDDPVALASHLHSIENYMMSPRVHMRFLKAARVEGSDVTQSMVNTAMTQFTKDPQTETLQMIGREASETVLRPSITSEQDWIQELATTASSRLGINRSGAA